MHIIGKHFFKGSHILNTFKPPHRSAKQLTLLCLCILSPFSLIHVTLCNESPAPGPTHHTKTHPHNRNHPFRKPSNSTPTPSAQQRLDSAQRIVARAQEQLTYQQTILEKQKKDPLCFQETINFQKAKIAFTQQLLEKAQRKEAEAFILKIQEGMEQNRQDT